MATQGAEDRAPQTSKATPPCSTHTHTSTPTTHTHACLPHRCPHHLEALAHCLSETGHVVAHGALVSPTLTAKISLLRSPHALISTHLEAPAHCLSETGHVVAHGALVAQP